VRNGDGIETGTCGWSRDNGAPNVANLQPGSSLFVDLVVPGVIGGVSSSQALAWNRRTCRPDSDGQLKWVQVAPWSQEGDPQAANTASGRVPMRGTGTDRLVVAMKAL
jgi:hypothetical protein